MLSSFKQLLVINSKKTITELSTSKTELNWLNIINLNTIVGAWPLGRVSVQRLGQKHYKNVNKRTLYETIQKNSKFVVNECG